MRGVEIPKSGNRRPSAGEDNAFLVFYCHGASIEQCCASVIAQEPNGDEGSGCEERENMGFTRSGR